MAVVRGCVVKRGAPLKPVSAKRKREQRTYMKRRAEFLRTHSVCAICQLRPSTELHHMRGRVGSLFLDERYWMGLCSEDHRTVTENPSWAYEQGWSLRRIGAAS